MPRNENPVQRMEDLTPEVRAVEPLHSQEHWYLLASAFTINATVLDVGAGDGSGARIMEAHATASLLCIDPLPADARVEKVDVSCFKDGAFDAVTCFDVIEHVEGDTEFLCHLLRVADSLVFLSTPNWNSSKCKNKYHVREYTPAELQVLLKGLTYVIWTSGANRIDYGVQRCSTFDDCLVNFCVMIRAPSCSNKTWNAALLTAEAAAKNIAGELGSLGKWADEWTAEIRKIYDPAAPVPSYLELTKWLMANVRLLEHGPELKHPVDVLRHGAGTALQQQNLIKWCMYKAFGE